MLSESLKKIIIGKTIGVIKTDRHVTSNYFLQRTNTNWRIHMAKAKYNVKTGHDTGQFRESSNVHKSVSRLEPNFIGDQNKHKFS